jgi:hypothetical protein
MSREWQGIDQISMQPRLLGGGIGISITSGAWLGSRELPSDLRALPD